MIFKIIAIGIVGVVLNLLLKNHHKTFSVFIPIVFGVIVLTMLYPNLMEIVDYIGKMGAKANVSSEYIKLIFKVIGIAFVCEFGSNIAKDAGENAMSAKIDLVGRVLIMIYACPLLFELFNMVTTLIK